jgi:hypothetical protein
MSEILQSSVIIQNNGSIRRHRVGGLTQVSIHHRRRLPRGVEGAEDVSIRIRHRLINLGVVVTDLEKYNGQGSGNESISGEKMKETKRFENVRYLWYLVCTYRTVYVLKYRRQSPKWPGSCIETRI